MVTPPSREEGLLLHQRLMQGDETASADIFGWYLKPLVLRLESRNKGIATYDMHLIEEAVSEALFAYIENPGKFDPSKKSLSSYLYMAAFGDLLNAWRKVTHQLKVEEEVVELAGHYGNSITEGQRDIVAELVEQKEQHAQFRADARQKWSILRSRVRSEEDLLLLDLMFRGIHETAPYAVIMGIDTETEVRQQHTVKQAKDRLAKFMERGGLPRDQWIYLVREGY